MLLRGRCKSLIITTNYPIYTTKARTLLNIRESQRNKSNIYIVSIINNYIIYNTSISLYRYGKVRANGPDVKITRFCVHYQVFVRAR